jgi:hypothetical protein
MQRKKLTLLPRSEHAQEQPPTSSSSTDEVKSKSNPFGSAKPVDTLSAIKKVEEKLAKEKEHKEEQASAKTSAPSTSSPSSPTTQRPEKAPRNHPKQLLRRTSANPTSPPPPPAAAQSEIDPVVAAKAEAQNEAIAEGASEGTWRKPESVVGATTTAPEEEPGWNTVPARSKKVNGVGARH